MLLLKSGNNVEKLFSKYAIFIQKCVDIPGMWDKILDIDSCHLQRDPSNKIRNFVKNKAEELKMHC